MSVPSLKQALSEDLTALKTLKVGIIPGRIYYRDLFLGWLLLFSLFLGIQSLACFFAVQTNAWEYAPNYKFYKSFSLHTNKFFNDDYHISDPFEEERELKKKFPNITPDEIDQMIIKNRKQREAEHLQRERKHEAEQLKLQEESKALVAAQRETEHLRLVGKMLFGVFFSSLFFSLFLVGKLKLYVIFKHQLQSQLQTGDYLAQKMKLAFWGFFLVFGCLAFIAIPLFEQDVVFFSGIPCLIGAGFTIVFAINLEASRLGVSVLFTALNEYFGRRKGTAV